MIFPHRSPIDWHPSLHLRSPVEHEEKSSNKCVACVSLQISHEARNLVNLNSRYKIRHTKIDCY